MLSVVQNGIHRLRLGCLQRECFEAIKGMNSKLRGGVRIRADDRCDYCEALVSRPPALSVEESGSSKLNGIIIAQDGLFHRQCYMVMNS